jgi:hypothetical protein
MEVREFGHGDNSILVGLAMQLAAAHEENRTESGIFQGLDMTFNGPMSEMKLPITFKMRDQNRLLRI